jgi:RHS repeat-associated protein
MTYNKANHMATAVVSGTTSTYGYDAFGQRLKATDGSNPLSVTQYGLNGEILSETNSSVETDYVWIDGNPVAAIQPAAATISYIHPDRLGTPQKATDASKAVVFLANYLPFGVVTPTTSITQNLRFPGMHADATGYYRNGFRDYDPPIGAYLEPDPLGLKGGLPIVYAGSNPFKYIDPLGLCPANAPDCVEPAYPPETIAGFVTGGGPAARGTIATVRAAYALVTGAPVNTTEACKVANTTAKGADATNYSTDQTPEQMQQQLQNGGYQRSVAGRNGDVINYTKDGVTYSFYPGRSSVPGSSGVQVINDCITTTKITPGV